MDLHVDRNKEVTPGSCNKMVAISSEVFRLGDMQNIGRFKRRMGRNSGNCGEVVLS